MGQPVGRPADPAPLCVLALPGRLWANNSNVHDPHCDPTRQRVLSAYGPDSSGRPARKEEPMKVLNPWIDPRVEQVRSAAAQDYLVRHGWKPLPPAQPHMLPFAAPPGGDDSPVVCVPELEQAR